MRRTVRLALIATIGIVAVASAVAIARDQATPLAARSSASPTPLPPTATTEEAPTARPTPTCRVIRTPDYQNQEPPHAPVNGQPSLGVPTLRGVILVKIPQCRDIEAILRRYGLPGPATRFIDVAESDDMIANGATRWFRVVVTPGTESATVVELYRHPEDIEYVQLIPEFTGSAAGG
jgi:hypothetical protein